MMLTNFFSTPSSVDSSASASGKHGSPLRGAAVSLPRSYTRWRCFMRSSLRGSGESALDQLAVDAGVQHFNSPAPVIDAGCSLLGLGYRQSGMCCENSLLGGPLNGHCSHRSADELGADGANPRKQSCNTCFCVLVCSGQRRGPPLLLR